MACPDCAREKFRASPEYATLQYYFGLFMARGGDLARAQRHFARLLDVDVFEDLHMAGARRQYGNALCRQARGDIKVAIEFAEEAIRLIPKSCEYSVHTDALALLASLYEADGNSIEAANAYEELSDRLKRWVGDEQRGLWAEDRAQAVRPFGHARKSTSRE